MDTMSSALSSSSDFRISLCSFSTLAGIPPFFSAAFGVAPAFLGLLALAAVFAALVTPVVVFFGAAFLLAGPDLEAAPVLPFDPVAAAARLRVVVFAMARPSCLCHRPGAAAPCAESWSV